MSSNDNFEPRGRLLQPRADTAKQLSCTVERIRKLEDRGYLKAIRLGESRQSPVFHSVEQVDLLVQMLTSGEIEIEL